MSINFTKCLLCATQSQAGLLNVGVHVSCDDTVVFAKFLIAL